MRNKEPGFLTRLFHRDFGRFSETAKAEPYVIYADRYLLAEDFMAQHRILFKKIPRDIPVL